MANVFLAFLATGISGTLLASVLILSKKFFRKFFPSKWLYFMWTAVLVIMILPMQFDITEFLKSDISTQNSTHTGEVQFLISKPEETGKNPSETVKNDYQSEAETSKKSIFRTKINEKITVLNQKITDFLPFLAVFWLLFAVLLFLFKILSYIGFYHHTIINSKEISLPKIKKYTKKNIHVRVSTDATSPFLIGIIHPILVLPKIDFTDENLDFILRHETIHLKRFDILIKWFAIIVKCIHFYNPVVYFICSQHSEECEISCDAEVVNGMNDHQKRAYVQTILTLLQSSKQVIMPLTTGMTGSKEKLKTRFILIKNSRKKGKKSLTFSIMTSVFFIALTVMFSAFTGCKSKLPDKPSETSSVLFDSTVNTSNEIYVGFIRDGNLSWIDVLDKSGNTIMSIPTSVAENLPAFEKTPGETKLRIYCGKIDQFIWAGVTTKNVMNKNHINICISHDGGKNWYVNPDGCFGKGIVENIWFVTEKDGYVSYSGGGYGKGISVTSDGGATWKHYMEYGYPLPLSPEDALKLLKHQLIFAYTQKYGYYVPMYEDPRTNPDTSVLPGGYVGDELWLPFLIEHLEITDEDEDYYTVPVVWDFKIEKATGSVFMFYDGLDKALIPFEPYSPNALAFAG